MKKFKSDDLIDKLQEDVRQLVMAAEHFRTVDKIKLNHQPAEGSWSAMQAMEHLNMYNRFYLPVIEKAVAFVSKERDAWFVPGFFGNYFTRLMQPNDVYEVKNKMKAPKGYYPESKLNSDDVLQEFVQHQNKLLQLLEISRKRNLNKIRIPISISRLIKLKLGDTFRFLIAHEQRHMIQARNAIKAVGVSTSQFPVIMPGQVLAAV